MGDVFKPDHETFPHQTDVVAIGAVAEAENPYDPAREMKVAQKPAL